MQLKPGHTDPVIDLGVSAAATGSRRQQWRRCRQTGQLIARRWASQHRRCDTQHSNDTLLSCIASTVHHRQHQPIQQRGCRMRCRSLHIALSATNLQKRATGCCTTGEIAEVDAQQVDAP